jgi:hypothetical protein
MRYRGRRWAGGIRAPLVTSDTCAAVTALRQVLKQSKSVNDVLYSRHIKRSLEAAFGCLACTFAHVLHSPTLHASILRPQQCWLCSLSRPPHASHNWQLQQVGGAACKLALCHCHHCLTAADGALAQLAGMSETMCSRADM